MRKIKLNPNRQQRKKLDRFAGAARFTYNQCVEDMDRNGRRLTAKRVAAQAVDAVLLPDTLAEFVRNVFHNVHWKTQKERKWKASGDPDDVEGLAAELAANAVHNVLRKHREEWKDSASYRAWQRRDVASKDKDRGSLEYRFRNAFVTAESREGRVNELFVEHPWLKDTPKVVRQQAAFQAAAAYKSAFVNLRNKNIARFRVRYASKKRELERGYTLGVEKQLAFAKEADGGWALTVLPKSIGKIRFFEKPPIDGKPIADCKVHKDKCGDYWLLVPVRKPKKPPTCGPPIAIDPGGVVPFACYSPAGEAFFEGRAMNARLEAVRIATSAVDKKLSKARGALKERLALRRRKLFRRAERVRDDCHWKILNEWTKRYGGIVLPALQTRRLSGGLRAKSNRVMFGVSHYTFLQRARFKCEETSCLFASPGEEYTTKTCGNCGVQRKPDGDRVFRCKSCGLSCNRDLHAARNIYVKWLAENLDGGFV